MMADEVTATTTAQVHFVLIGLCTYHRPTGLKQAMASVRDLEIPQGVRMELVVVDNNEDGSADHLVRRFSEVSSFVVHYCHEPVQGISSARNRVLDFALSVGLIDEQPQCTAFFDDDEILDSKWLVNYLSHYTSLKHTLGSEAILILTGPVHFELPERAPKWSRKADVFRPLRFTSGTRRQWAATNNVLFDTALIREHRLRFDLSLSLYSGEDQLFFMQAARRGAEIVWVEEAVVYEVVEDRRTTCGWILRHCYGYSSNGFFLYSKLFPSQRMKVVVLSLCKGCLYLCYGFFLLGTLGMFTWIFSRFRYCTINALALISRGSGWLCGILGLRYRVSLWGR